MKIIDAHSHIDYITHNYQSDVVRTICCATNESEWDKLTDMITRDKNIYGAFGVHPWFVDEAQFGFEKRLYDLLQSNDDFMVGEIGLDKFKPNMDNQIDVFCRQMNIAVELNRTVFLHCVGAWDKILHILKSYKKLPAIVAHDFNGSIDILNTLIKNYDIMFSLHRINADLIGATPIDKIMVETDGKNNIILQDIIDKISIIKNEPDANDIIYKNTQRILNK